MIVKYFKLFFILTFLLPSFAAGSAEEVNLNINELPAEILMKIGENLEDSKDMGNFRATCKTFKSIADDPEKSLHSHLTLRGIGNVETLLMKSPNEIAHILLISDPLTLSESLVTPDLLEKVASSIRITPQHIAQYFGYRHPRAFHFTVKASVERSPYPLMEGFEESLEHLDRDALLEKCREYLVQTKLLTALFEVYPSKALRNPGIGLDNTFRFKETLPEEVYPCPDRLHNVLRLRIYNAVRDAEGVLRFNYETTPALEYFELLDLAAPCCNYSPYFRSYSGLSKIYKNQNKTHELYLLSELIIDAPIQEEDKLVREAHLRIKTEAISTLIHLGHRQEAKQKFKKLLRGNLPVESKVDLFLSLLYSCEEDISLEEYGLGDFMDQMISTTQHPRLDVLCAKLEYKANYCSKRFKLLFDKIKRLSVYYLKDLDPGTQFDIAALLFVEDFRDEKITQLLENLLTPLDPVDEIKEYYIDIAHMLVLKGHTQKAREALNKVAIPEHRFEDLVEVLLLLEDFIEAERIIDMIAKTPKHASYDDFPVICSSYYSSKNKEALVPYIDVLKTFTGEEDAGTLLLLFQKLGYEKEAREAYERLKPFIAKTLGYGFDKIKNDIETKLPSLARNRLFLEKLKIHVDPEMDEEKITQKVRETLLMSFSEWKKAESLSFEAVYELLDKITLFSYVTHDFVH